MLGVHNVLNLLNVLNVLNVLNMPMDASFACWALFTQYRYPHLVNQPIPSHTITSTSPNSRCVLYKVCPSISTLDGPSVGLSVGNQFHWPAELISGLELNEKM